MNDGRKRKRQRSGKASQQPIHRPAQLSIPVSLGKPSLRIRLEAYYSLIAPNAIADESEWRRKFEIIYQKYGGSVEQEAALALKLAKKYGSTIRLRLTETTMSSSTRDDDADGMASNCGGGMSAKLEEWYEPLPAEEGSCIVEFISDRFDPVAALSSTYSQVCKANPFAQDSLYLDNVSRFQSLLPLDDPKRKVVLRKGKKNLGLPVTTSDMRVKVPVFTAIVAGFENAGPLSLLHSIHVKRQRIRVMVRYIDCIRGTLTGYLLAFDKHMNMILRDVDEVYSARVTKAYEGMGLSKPELEYQRRICLQQGHSYVINKREGRHSDDSPMKLRKRYCQQLLLRGDTVVMVWRAEAERSAWPKSKFSARSGYTDKGYKQTNKVGTPGCVNSNTQKQYNSSDLTKPRGRY